MSKEVGEEERRARLGGGVDKRIDNGTSVHVEPEIDPYRRRLGGPGRSQTGHCTMPCGESEMNRGVCYSLQSLQQARQAPPVDSVK